jgi:peptidoglycan/LPS O-acetylase OafA/YrhL
MTSTDTSTDFDQRVEHSRDKAEIKAMTGLRGVAAILVATYHFYPTDSAATYAVARFVGKGYLWVDLFFVLSGFLLALNYAHLFAAGWSLRGWIDFLLRRLARIYPLYFAIVIAGLAYALAAHGALTGASPPAAVPLDAPARPIAANLLIVQSWGIAASINGAAWSLSTEWAAYLLFPMLVGLALFGRPKTALVSTIAVAALKLATVALTKHDGAYHRGPLDAYDGTTAQPILRCVGGFALGLLTYRAARAGHAAWAAHDATVGAVVALLALGLAAGAHDLFVYPLFALLVLGLYRNRGWAGRAFGCRPVHWLGMVSYSIYLLHVYLVRPRHDVDAWLDAHLAAPWGPIATSLGIYAVLLVASGLAFYTIEEPGRRWMHRLRIHRGRVG